RGRPIHQADRGPGSRSLRNRSGVRTAAHGGRPRTRGEHPCSCAIVPHPTQELIAMSKGRFSDLSKFRHDRRRASRRNIVGRSLGPESLEVRTLLSFAPPVTFPVGVDPRAVTVADFNNDGKPDLAVVNQGPFSTSTSQSSLSVLLGNGNG